MSDDLFVITVSHQIGSGGGLVGQSLAERLGIPFFDREILRRVSDELHIAEADVANREQRLSNLGDTLSRFQPFLDPAASLTPAPYVPTDRELFRLESEIICRIAEKRSAVFLGRAGRHILDDHPRHLSLLVHAARPARIARIKALYHIEDRDAERMIDSNDAERAAYIRAFTDRDWTDARQYDLCLNTSTCGPQGAVELAVACLKHKFPDLARG
jgi:cytidylate kinase